MDRPSSNLESIHPMQLSMIQTSVDVTVASTPKAAIVNDGAGNPPVIPPGYMLIPITPLPYCCASGVWTRLRVRALFCKFSPFLIYCLLCKTALVLFITLGLRLRCRLHCFTLDYRCTLVNFSRLVF